MARYAFNISRYLQSPHKSLELLVCGSTKSCITMKVISLWTTSIKDGFFPIYLSLFFLRLYRRVVWRLQKVSSFFHCSDTRVSFCFIFLISTTCFFFKPKTILIVHIHFPIKYRTNTNRSICLHLFSCSQRLLVERYTHSDRLITNHLWCHCSIVVKFFFLICVFDHDDWTFASFFFPFLWTLTSSRSIKKGRGRTKPILSIKDLLFSKRFRFILK